jgi:hypothetical protein
VSAKAEVPIKSIAATRILFIKNLLKVFLNEARSAMGWLQRKCIAIISCPICMCPDPVDATPVGRSRKVDVRRHTTRFCLSLGL